MKFSLVIMALFCTTIVVAQSGKLRRADNYYNTLAYSMAAEQYEGLLGSEVDSPRMKAKLAHCYFRMGNTVKAEQYYAQVVITPEAQSEDIYNYAQSLKENGKYTESDEWMSRFAVLKQNDIRAMEFWESQNYLQEIEKQGNHFEVKNLKVNSAATDFGGYPSVDQKSVYFVTSRHDRSFVKNVWMWKNEQFLDLYTGKQDAEQEITTPELMTRRVNSRYHEGPLCFSTDGKKVFFTRNNISGGKKRNDDKGIQNLKLYMADVLADGSWGNEREFVYNSRDYSVGHPALSADGKYLYFASDMPGGFGGADIYRVSIGSGDEFGRPENLGKQINTEGQDMFPWLNNDGYLFFASDGHIGLGGLDIYVMIPDDKGKIAKVLNAGKPVNSQKDDFAFTMLSDNKHGYFSSNREGGLGEDDIYSYVLTKPFKIDLFLEGVAQELGTGIRLPGAEVRLKNTQGQVLEVVTADENGAYRFKIEPDNDYVIEAKQNDYFDNQTAFTSKNLPNGTDLIEQNIDLEKDPGLALYALVTDADSKLPLSGVQITILDNAKKAIVIDQLTGNSGDAMKGLKDKKVNDQLSYTITLSKEGYLTKTIQFSTKITAPGVINVHEQLDMTLSKIEVGADLATMIDIKPIYFDLGKYVIRPDAAKELDKIVKVMNEYPTMQIELGSHTDCRGSIASNEKLSDNRAKASAAYVRARISNPDRIYGKGYGESKLKNGCGCEGPVKSTCSEAEHQENRRTEFIIIKM